MGFLAELLNLVFPPKCAFCRRLLSNSDKDGMCNKCRKELPFLSGVRCEKKGDYFTLCVAALEYKENVRSSILRYKFNGKTNYAKTYGKILADCIQEHFAGKYDLISWVPLSKKRKKKRGYDQAMLLCMAAALELDDAAAETLKKEIDVPAQSGIGSAEKRRANISGAYRAVDTELVKGKRILLIDDVVTTGATLSECSKVLLMAGAETVYCAALAKASK